MPWRREWLPTPVFLPGEFHGQMNMAGYSPLGCKESGTTEQLTHKLLTRSAGETGLGMWPSLFCERVPGFSYPESTLELFCFKETKLPLLLGMGNGSIIYEFSCI